MNTSRLSLDNLRLDSIDVTNLSVAVIPFPALGDTTIYLRVAQTLSLAGAKVCLYSDILAGAADLFDWLTILPLAPYDVADISAEHDLVIVDVLAHKVQAFDDASGKLAALPNVLAVSAKHFPSPFKMPSRPACLAKSRATNVHAPFCPGSGRGPSMVEWVDLYMKEVFGLAASPMPPPVRPPIDSQGAGDSQRRILVFPTTPNPNKNFPLAGFRRLSSLLRDRGWQTEIICMTHEEAQLSSFFKAETVRSFPALRDLILHLQQSAAVVSNDSGGGHFGSMLGLPTFTITKKNRDFVWRPGFNDNNVVISPILTLKWFSGRLWAPFIPLRRIVQTLGHAPASLA